MQDEQVEQGDEAAEATAEEATADETTADETTADETTADETTADVEGAAPDAGDTEVAAAVDQQAEESSGTAAEQAPEVPDDASATISRAQEHIDKLDMNEEREAAKRAM